MNDSWMVPTTAALAVWFGDYCDPMMRELTSRGGHTLPVTWPLAEPPAGMFRDADHPEE